MSAEMGNKGSEEEEDLPVLIIGAGACGLAIAHGLQNANIPCKVFEQQASLEIRSARDWAVACHWSAPTLKQLIGEAKWARISETQTDAHSPVKEHDLVNVINGATGETVNHLPFDNFYRFRRSKLRQFLAEDMLVVFGKKLVDYEVITSYETEAAGDGDAGRNRSRRKVIIAHFADGTSARGRLLIGADGSQSRVRHLLLGPVKAALNRLPLVATFINASFTPSQAQFLRTTYHPLFNIIVHPANMLAMLSALSIPDSQAPETWQFTFYISWRCSVAEQDADMAPGGIGNDARRRLMQAKEMSRRYYADPIRSVLEWTSDDLNTVYWGGVANWDPSLPENKWDNHGGLVTLVGDAAHPMTYHRGQGLNHAIEDAGKLVTLLSDPANRHRPQSNMIDEYETEMRSRAGHEVRVSETNSLMLHDWSQASESPLLKHSLAQVRDVEPTTVLPDENQ